MDTTTKIVLAGAAVASAAAGMYYFFFQNRPKVAITSPITHGATATWTATGFTPDSALSIVVTWAGGGSLSIQGIGLDSTGSVTAAFTVGTNIPSGTDTFTVTDTTGKTASARLVVE